MKTQEKTKTMINKNSHVKSLSSFDEKFSSELKFIVPWFQIDKSKLENYKSVSKNQKI